MSQNITALSSCNTWTQPVASTSEVTSYTAMEIVINLCAVNSIVYWDFDKFGVACFIGFRRKPLVCNCPRSHLPTV